MEMEEGWRGQDDDGKEEEEAEADEHRVARQQQEGSWFVPACLVCCLRGRNKKISDSESIH